MNNEIEDAPIFNIDKDIAKRDPKSDIMYLFENTPMLHGTEFDNGKRWCAVCDCTQMPIPRTNEDLWAEKMCPNCSTCWPEFASEYVWRSHNDPDFEDNFEHIILN
jgi:hypothetical protein